MADEFKQPHEPGSTFSIYVEKVQTWFNSHRKSGPECPVCESVDWQVGPMAEAPIRATDLRFGALSGQVLPIVPIACGTCSYTMFFNAVIMGLVQPAPPESRGS